MNKEEIMTEIKELTAGFPMEYSKGYTTWAEEVERSLSSTWIRPCIGLVQVRSFTKKLAELAERTGDHNVKEAYQLASELFGKVKKSYEEDIKWVFHWYDYDDTLKRKDEILRFFFNDNAFEPYRKGCRGWANPNAKDSLTIEFGMLDKKGNWKRTGLRSATHIGLQVDFSYINLTDMRDENVIKTYSRDFRNRRGLHPVRFLVAPVREEWKSTVVMS